jgi:PD-(D/E)XK nuclease superfamily
MTRPYVVKSRGLFTCDSKEPFKISRSQIEAFVDCPRCFYLNNRLGMRRPSSPPFTINSLVDHLLKREFDTHRAAQTPHPIMVEHGLDAVPFQHSQIDEWRENFVGMQFIDERTNLKITGAVDDIWQMRESGKLIIVDYKATAKSGEVNIDADWQMAYKRQMEIYTWLLRKQGFDVEDRGFFLYCNGKDAESFDGKLGFLISLLPYTGNSEWVEPTLLELKACLMHDEAPSASAGCEFCGYIAATHKVENGRVATPPPPPRRPISNRHPADQIADVKQQIAVLKKQETDLREILINATELDRVGDDWIAKVSEQKKRLLDREALENHFGADTLQPFMRESVATVLKLMDRHTRTRPFPGLERIQLSA